MFSSFHLFSHLGEQTDSGLSSVDNWILATSFWRDTGVWIDTDVWID